MRWIVILLGLWDLQAQTAPAPLTFEVASIKRSALDVQGMFGPTTSGGSVRVVGATLKNLVSIAYGVRQSLVFGGPAWVESDRFDINARAEAPADPDKALLQTLRMQMPQRLKSLLAERFQLAAHRESKEQTVYTLVVAKNGPKLHEAAAGSNHMVHMKRTTIDGQGVGIQMLVTNLASALDHPVIDKTGLKGTYDFKVEWSPDTSTEGPSLVTAVQEQLGLRLESQKAPVEVLFIDHAERPSAN